MNRRDFLKLCGASAGAGVITGALPAARATRRATQPPRRLIVVFAVGGWDTAYALDPKTPDFVDVPVGTVQRFGDLDIFVDASRPSVTEFFTRYAANTALVRGIATEAITHNECQRRIATGTREERRADIGAIVAHELGNDLPLPYLILGDIAFVGEYAAGSGRVGANTQIIDLLGHGATGEWVTGDGPVQQPTLAEDTLLTRYADASAARARATRGALGYNRRRVDDFASSIARAEQLRSLHDRFGSREATFTLEAQAGVALDAIEQDIAHAVMLTTQLGWDTHGDNFLQAEYHETAFAALVGLVDELVARPGRAAGTRMIDDTVVLCISEMGRANRLGGDPAHAGKDHWPVTSALVIGAGVAGGRVIGATTPDVQPVAIDLATGAPTDGGTRVLYGNFIAGALALCGVDPGRHLGNTAVLDALVG